MAILSVSACYIILYSVGAVGFLFGMLQWAIVGSLSFQCSNGVVVKGTQEEVDQFLAEQEGQEKVVEKDIEVDGEGTLEGQGLLQDQEQEGPYQWEHQEVMHVFEITNIIQKGANSFLMKEYFYCLIFIVVFSIILFCTVEKSFGQGWTTCAFVAGAVTSIISGYLGMKVAVYANGRVALTSKKSLSEGFVVAFRAGSVLGFVLCSLGLIVLVSLQLAYNSLYSDIDYVDEATKVANFANFQAMYESIAGFGLGGSSIALFGRVGGGIYTKAADVGADLVGKVEQGFDEDSPKNPGTIADNVGDNVGDVAGMGADLFGSFAESNSATLVVASTVETFWKDPNSQCAMFFPASITAVGLIVCLITTFFATNVMSVNEVQDEATGEMRVEINVVENCLKMQLVISTILMTPAVYLAMWMFLPDTWQQDGYPNDDRSSWMAFVSVISGVWGGLIIGYITEYYTSYNYNPTQEVAASCETGAATNIIYGLALGYLSTVIPIIVLAIIAYTSHKLLGMLGIGLAALGMLSTLSCGLTIDAYGPISDNAGGISEMCALGERTRERTDALDAAGNTTAAIGKGFAIGSAALVAMALFGAFITRQQNYGNVSIPLCPAVITIIDPLIFSGLLIGAMLPYAFSAMTMKSVGEAALDMVKEIRRQIKEMPGIVNGTETPDYQKCIEISTAASLREMILPGVLVMGTPIVTGILFGPKFIAGLLPGATVSGIQMAISSSNTGGAWDNAKKFVEADKLVVDGQIRGKNSEEHKAAVCGDTVGDPLKDTSGPSLNILIKLSAIVSLVFAKFFDKTAFLAGVLKEETHDLCPLHN